MNAVTPENYTILVAGSPRFRGCTLAEAADWLLTEAGYAYEIRPDYASGEIDGYILFLSPWEERRKSYGKYYNSNIFSLRRDEASATQDIYLQIVRRPEHFVRNTEVVPDHVYLDQPVEKCLEDND
jgi:hypothetical protein